MLYPLSQPYGDANGYKKYRTCFLFRVTTSSGISGWGECIDWLPLLEKGFKERIIPFLVGKEATQRLQLVKTIKKWDQRAAAGVSMALTEIVATYAGLNVCDLWGGRWRNQVPVYASFQSYTERDDWLNHSIHLVDKAISTGFDQLKVKIGGRAVEEDQAHIEALQNLAQGKARLALDGNESYDLSTTRRWTKLFTKWDNLLWLEEPMPLDHVKEYKLLRASLDVPLAGGENLQSAAKFMPLISEGALDITQPDVMHQDGIDGFRDTLQLSRHFGLRCSPHAFDGILSRLYAIFSQACLSPWSKMDEHNIEPVEWDVMENPFTELLTIKPIGGFVPVPKGIGIGVELDMEKITGLLWDGRTYI
jgi:D-galactarolactone cycloisomerase